jgi:hypothetical protein
MKLKSLIFFALSVAICLIGATTRIHDSAHSIGTLSLKGGKVNHPALLDDERSRYTIIATGTVRPPFQGDVRVALEGQPEFDYRIYNSRPVVDLGFFRRPRFINDTFYDIRPEDKVALWVVMTPRKKDANRPWTTQTSAGGLPASQCCEPPAITGGGSGRRHEGTQGPIKGERLSIAFYDTKTEKQVMRIPIIFKGKGGGGDVH